jgi:hypothetical protein
MINPDRGIPSIVHSLARSCSLVPTSNETLRSKNYSLIGRGISKHEGPLGSRAIIENSSYIGGYEFLHIQCQSTKLIRSSWIECVIKFKYL